MSFQLRAHTVTVRLCHPISVYNSRKAEPDFDGGLCESKTAFHLLLFSMNLELRLYLCQSFATNDDRQADIFSTKKNRKKITWCKSPKGALEMIQNENL